MEGLENDVCLEVVCQLERRDDEEFSHEIILCLTATDELYKTGFGKNDPSHKPKIPHGKGSASQPALPVSISVRDLWCCIPKYPTIE